MYYMRGQFDEEWKLSCRQDQASLGTWWIQSCTRDFWQRLVYHLLRNSVPSSRCSSFVITDSGTIKAVCFIWVSHAHHSAIVISALTVCLQWQNKTIAKIRNFTHPEMPSTIAVSLQPSLMKHQLPVLALKRASSNFSCCNMGKPLVLITFTTAMHRHIWSLYNTSSTRRESDISRGRTVALPYWDLDCWWWDINLGFKGKEGAFLI